jgi:hypothetical protein
VRRETMGVLTKLKLPGTEVDAPTRGISSPVYANYG